MAYDTKDNSGLVAVNQRKEKDTHPDYQGQCRIDGHDYWISGWKKTSAKGPFLSLAFKRKDGTAARPETPQQRAFNAQAPINRDLDDSVPF